MGMNIGKEAYDAVVALRGNRDFEKLLEALGDHYLRQLVAASASSVDLRVDRTAYMLGGWELVEGMQAAFEGKMLSQMPPPKVNRVRGVGKSEMNDV